MIYLDNSATTKQYKEVTEIMVKCMDEYFGNPSSLYQLGVDSEKMIKTARKQVSKSAGLKAEDRLVFTSGGSESDNMAIFGAVKALRRRGNRIVTTEVEHPAVLECCKELEKQGFEVKYVGVDSKCRLDTAKLRDAVNDKTILVTMMHVNNETGTVMPVDMVKDIMREKSAPGYFHCDAVQSFGKMRLPAGADMISLSGHKIHGPKGIGALIIKNGINIPPFILGGGQEKGMRSGTENAAAIAGLGLAAEMTCGSMESEMKRIGEIRSRLLDNIKQRIDGITVNSVTETGSKAGLCCPGIVNISFDGTRGEVLLHTLEQDGIYLSTGSACSSNKKGGSHVLKAMGLNDKETESALRFSLSRFNTIEETDYVAEKLSDAVKRFRALGSFR